jgi:hypothetical protein
MKHKEWTIEIQREFIVHKYVLPTDYSRLISLLFLGLVEC